ncbi:hypothetical protein [Frankia canadensis]|nr:hypothetical protein [Frankia canadensis]
MASPIVVWCAARLTLFVVAVLAQRWAKLSNADVVRLLNATAMKLPAGALSALVRGRSGAPPP